MSMQRIPVTAGQFLVFTGKRRVGGRERRVRVLQFVTADNYIGESRTFNHREAYENAIAERARSKYDADVNRLPKPWETCAKQPAPAPLIRYIDDSTIFSEVERRGYEVHVAEAAMALCPA